MVIQELSDAVARQIRARVPGQKSTRAEHVPEGRVQKPDGGLEDVEVPLVALYGAQSLEGR